MSHQYKAMAARREADKLRELAAEGNYWLHIGGGQLEIHVAIELCEQAAAEHQRQADWQDFFDAEAPTTDHAALVAAHHRRYDFTVVGIDKAYDRQSETYWRMNRWIAKAIKRGEADLYKSFEVTRQKAYDTIGWLLWIDAEAAPC